MKKKSNKLTIFFASSNKDKLKEIKNIFKSEKVKNIYIKNAPEDFKVNENGKTFIENAFKKAKKLSKEKESIAFADDSGIEVCALKMKPGIKSARYFKNGSGMLEIIKKIKNKKNKRCCFTCAIVVCNSKGKMIFKTQKSWYGIVSSEPKGKNGFGYDPIFIIPGLNKTSAELSSKEKDKLSHRGMAVREFAKWLKTYAFYESRHEHPDKQHKS